MLQAHYLYEITNYRNIYRNSSIYHPDSFPTSNQTEVVPIVTSNLFPGLDIISSIVHFQYSLTYFQYSLSVKHFRRFVSKSRIQYPTACDLGFTAARKINHVRLCNLATNYSKYTVQELIPPLKIHLTVPNINYLHVLGRNHFNIGYSNV